MKTILVPTDFSACAANAVDFAVHTAEMIHVEVIILHVFNIADKIYPDTIGVDGDYIEMMLQEVNGKLNELKATIKREKGIDVSVLLYEGEPTETILDATKEHDVDLILMGTMGASGAKEKLLGSETVRVMEKTQVPILVIPLDYHWKKPSKIVLATSHFEQDQVLLNTLFEWVTLFSAELQVVVFTDIHEKSSKVLENTWNAFEYEKVMRKWLNNDSISVRELSSEDLEESLQAYVEEYDMDCLVMITHKHNFWQRLFHPSIANKMSYHTKIPLLAIPG